MDKSTLRTLNKARVCLANGNIDQLVLIVDSLPADILCGTVFDRNDYPSCKEYLYSQIIELIKSKGIKKITKEDVDVLLKVDSNFNLSEKELERSFTSLNNNLNLFESKFKNRIYGVNTNNDKSILISVSACNLFHVLGFNFIRWQAEYREEILRLFPEFEKMLSMDYKKICFNEDRVLYDALYNIVHKKDEIIDEISTRNPNTIGALNLHKVRVKNYMFERSDFTGSPSGIITYNSTKDNLKSDTYIIKDIINQNAQEWSYFAFRNVPDRSYKCSESILYNYLTPEERMSQDVELIKSIDIYDSKKCLRNREVSSRIVFNDTEMEYLRTKLFKNNKVVRVKRKNIQ